MSVPFRHGQPRNGPERLRGSARPRGPCACDAVHGKPSSTLGQETERSELMVAEFACIELDR